MAIAKCPFCGGKGKVSGNYSEKRACFYVYVRCINCQARGKTFTSEETEKKASEKAIEAWNARAEGATDAS